MSDQSHQDFVAVATRRQTFGNSNGELLEDTPRRDIRWEMLGMNFGYLHKLGGSIRTSRSGTLTCARC